MPQYTGGSYLNLRKIHWKGEFLTNCDFPSLARETGVSQIKLQKWQAHYGWRGISYTHLRQMNCMVVYENCTEEELRKFVRQKRLRVDRDASWWDIVELLYENENFDRFLDLSAELRVLVYQHYFAFDAHHHHDIFRDPPPITEVSRLIRKEYLFEFWSSQRFRVCIVEDRKDEIFLHLKDQKFFREALRDQLRMIKKLLVDRWGFGCYWKVDLPSGDSPAADRFLYEQDEVDQRLEKFAEGHPTLSWSDEAKLADALRGYRLPAGFVAIPFCEQPD